jgi:uridine monophosphate synthetase
MVFKRKEAKDYGCKKMVEGTYREGDVCLLIEDVVVYGTSIIETADVYMQINFLLLNSI